MQAQKEKKYVLGSRVKDRHRVMLRKLTRRLKDSQELIVQRAIEEMHDRTFAKKET